MEKAPSVASDILVAVFMLGIVPLWMGALFYLTWREKRGKTQFLNIVRWARIPLILYLFTQLPMEEHPVFSIIITLIAGFAFYYGLYKYESSGWTKEVKRTFIRNQVMQVGSTLIFITLGILLILFRFPDEKW